MIGDILQVSVLLVLLIQCFRWARREEDNLYLIFAALFYATTLLSDLYYLTHTYLREGMRVPFAANDIADFGSFLLMSTALRSAVGRRRGKLPGVAAASLAFASVNVVLWIAWSGEWVRDILGGFSWGWFLWVCFDSLYQTEALRRGERVALWLVCALVSALQTSALLLPAAKVPLETGGYCLLALTEAWFLLRILLSLRRGQRTEAALSLSFTGSLWVTASMYMTDGVLYNVFANLFTLHLALILLAIRKKVKAA